MAQMSTPLLACITAMTALMTVTQCAPSGHLVHEMPFYKGNAVNFKTYSGYLNATTGRLFYMFSESARSPSTDPLVLWLNGGPGCSSLLGQFIENGPWHPYASDSYGDVNIEYNPYSWNQMANMLFLESPPCVGFSYPYSMNCSSYITDDNTTKHDNLAAVNSFLDKYPEYEHRPFYITGESYAGHYIPQLAALIVDENQKSDRKRFINLTAIGVGNPYINRDNNWFEGWIPTMYNFGIINGRVREELLTASCANGTFTGKCANSSWYFVDEYVDDLNVYDVNVRANVCKLSLYPLTCVMLHCASHLLSELKFLKMSVESWRHVSK